MGMVFPIELFDVFMQQEKKGNVYDASFVSFFVSFSNAQMGQQSSKCKKSDRQKTYT